jgi:isopenicillin-N N-acyltransferase like protein
VNEIAVAGNPQQRGRAIGAATAVPIHEFLAEGVARLSWIGGAPVDRDLLQPAIKAHAEVVENTLPDIAAAVRGLAEGARIRLEDAWLLQLRRELQPIAAADCTTLAGPGWLSQTVDLAGNLSEHALVLRERSHAGEVVHLTFTGLLGYLGMNNRGLAVGINMVMSDGWCPGVPPYLIVRHLLGLRSVSECLSELPHIPRASSRCYTLVDSSEAVMVETTCDKLAILRGEHLVHTNHYLAPELAPLDRSHVLHRRESRRRRDRALAALALVPSTDFGDARQAKLGDLLELLCQHGEAGICFHGDGDPRRPSTVAAVALSPATGQILVRRGPPCLGATSNHDLEIFHA